MKKIIFFLSLLSAVTLADTSQAATRSCNLKTSSLKHTVKQTVRATKASYVRPTTVRTMSLRSSTGNTSATPSCGSTTFIMPSTTTINNSLSSTTPVVASPIGINENAFVTPNTNTYIGTTMSANLPGGTSAAVNGNIGGTVTGQTDISNGSTGLGLTGVAIPNDTVGVRGTIDLGTNGATVNGGYSSNLNTGTLQGASDIYGTPSTLQYGSGVPAVPNTGTVNGTLQSSAQVAQLTGVTTTTPAPSSNPVARSFQYNSSTNSATPYYHNFRAGNANATFHGFSQDLSSDQNIIKNRSSVNCGATTSDQSTGLNSNSIDGSTNGTPKGYDQTAGSGVSPRAWTLPNSFGPQLQSPNH